MVHAAGRFGGAVGLVLVSWIHATCEITQRESLLTSSGALHPTIPDMWGYFVIEHQFILGFLSHKKIVVELFLQC